MRRRRRPPHSETRAHSRRPSARPPSPAIAMGAADSANPAPRQCSRLVALNRINFGAWQCRACSRPTDRVIGRANPRYSPAPCGTATGSSAWATQPRPIPGHRSPDLDVALRPDSRTCVRIARHDIGNGVYTLLAITAADRLGFRIEDVVVELGDTDLPLAGLAAGSSCTASICNAAVKGCEEILARRPRPRLAPPRRPRAARPGRGGGEPPDRPRPRDHGGRSASTPRMCRRGCRRRRAARSRRARCPRRVASSAMTRRLTPTPTARSSSRCAATP